MSSRSENEPISDSKPVYLDRRGSGRVPFRSRIRFSSASHPLRLKAALIQNISSKGIQVLSPVLMERNKRFSMWIPLEGETVIQATAEAMWLTVEDTLADSPYWIRAGLQISVDRPEDQKLYSDFLSKRRSKTKAEDTQETKVSYIF